MCKGNNGETTSPQTLELERVRAKVVVSKGDQRVDTRAYREMRPHDDNDTDGDREQKNEEKAGTVGILAEPNNPSSCPQPKTQLQTDDLAPASRTS